MKGGGLIAGGLLAVIALIIYEQYAKNSVTKKSTAATTPVPITQTPQNPIPGATLTNTSPSQFANLTPGQDSANMAAQSLPQFSEGVDPSIIDFGVSPSFNGTEWTCPNGDIPYYDPATQTVYCVLAGAKPASAPIVIQHSLTDDVVNFLLGDNL